MKDTTVKSETIKGRKYTVLTFMGDNKAPVSGYINPEGMLERVFARVPKEQVFAQTGIQFMPINTLYQLMSLVERRSPQLGTGSIRGEQREHRDHRAGHA